MALCQFGHEVGAQLLAVGRGSGAELIHEPEPGLVVFGDPGKSDNQPGLAAHAEFGREHQKGDDRVHLVRQIPRPRSEGEHGVAPVVRPVEQIATQRCGRQGQGAEGKGGHDAEVPAAAAHSPEQLRILLRTGVHVLPGRSDQVHGVQVVQAQAAGPGQPAHTAAQGQSGHPRSTDDSQGYRQAVCGRGPVDVREGRSGFDGDMPALGVDAHLSEVSQIQDQSAADSSVAGDVVPAAADGQREPCAPRSLQDSVDVRHGPCPRDGTWTQIDHAVPHGAGFLVQGVLRLDQRSLQPPAQLVQGLLDFKLRMVLMNCGHR
jgi:hypothetical protein